MKPLSYLLLCGLLMLCPLLAQQDAEVLDVEPFRDVVCRLNGKDAKLDHEAFADAENYARPCLGKTADMSPWGGMGVMHIDPEHQRQWQVRAGNDTVLCLPPGRADVPLATFVFTVPEQAHYYIYLSAATSCCGYQANVRIDDGPEQDTGQIQTYHWEWTPLLLTRERSDNSETLARPILLTAGTHTLSFMSGDLHYLAVSRIVLAKTPVDPPVTYESYDKWSPLLDASWRGRTDEVARLLATGAPANCWGEMSTALGAAEYMGHASVAELLSAHGALPDAHVMAFVGAVEGRNPAALRDPLEACPELLNLKWPSGEMALRVAVSRGDAATVAALAAAGADLEAKRPLHHAVHHDVAVVKALLQAGANVNARNSQGETPLHLAPRLKNVEALLQAGADVDARDERGQTPLHHAYDPEVVEALLEAGADPNILTTPTSKSILDKWMKNERHPETVRRLREAGAKTSDELRADREYREAPAK